MMMLCMVISFSFVSSSSLASFGTLYLLCCTGETMWLTVIEYLPGILSIFVKGIQECVL